MVTTGVGNLVPGRGSEAPSGPQIGAHLTNFEHIQTDVGFF